MSSQRRRRSRASKDLTGAEMAFGFSLVSALLLLVGSLGLLQPAPPNPLSTFSVMVRSGAWQSIGLGLALAFAAAFLWRRLVLSAAAFAKTGLTRDDLRKLSPEQFEQWCAARLREQGFRVSEVGGQGDHGVDLIAERGDERIVVQCKRWFGIRLVGEPQVRDLYGAMHHESATGAMVITTGVFSEPALAWARGKPVLLWDVERLIGSTPLPAIQPAPITAASVQPCPKCSGTLVRRVSSRNQRQFWGCSSFPKCHYTQTI